MPDVAKKCATHDEAYPVGPPAAEAASEMRRRKIVAADPGEALSGHSYSATKLAPEDEWIGKLDLCAFRDEIKALGKELALQQGPADLAHLNKIVWWSRLSQWVGALTMWYSINPVSIFLLSVGCMTRWTCVGHHVCRMPHKARTPA